MFARGAARRLPRLLWSPQAIRSTIPDGFSLLSAQRIGREAGRRKYTAKNAMNFSTPHVATPPWITALHIAFFVVGSLVPVVLISQFIDTVPVSGRRRIMIVGRDSERSLGAAAVSDIQKQGTVLEADHPFSRAVASVGSRIAAAVHDVEQDVCSEAPAAVLGEAAVRGGAPPAPSALIPPAQLGAEVGSRPPWALGSEGVLATALGGPVRRRAAAAVAALHPAADAESAGAAVGDDAAANTWDWHFFVVDNPAKNAFCAPGGTVVVFTGLLHFIDEKVASGELQSRENALATVMSHEIAHAMCRHVAETLSFRATLIPLFDVLLAESSPLLHIAYTYLHSLPYSRLMEREADEVGLLLLSRACYDSSQAGALYAALDTTPSALQWTSTHPVGRLRAEDARRGASVLVPLQPAWCGGGGDPLLPTPWAAWVRLLGGGGEASASGVERLLTVPVEREGAAAGGGSGAGAAE